MKAFKLLYRAIFPILKHFLYPNSKVESYLFRNIHVGKGVLISKNCNIWETSIGDYSFIGKNTSIDFVESIGKYCSISKYVHLGLGSHPHETLSTSPVFYSAKRGFVKKTTFNEQSHPTIIENDVLIGANTCVLRGVKISNGAIVGAGSIVTKDIPPYAIAVGNPAKVVKYRFDQVTIDKLLASKWWEKDFDEALKLYNEHLTNIEQKK